MKPHPTKQNPKEIKAKTPRQHIGKSERFLVDRIFCMSTSGTSSPLSTMASVVDEDDTTGECTSSSTSADEMSAERGKKRKKTERYSGEEGEAKLRARREANRIHAFKSRQRNKQLMSELQQTVVVLNRQKNLLEQRNAALEAQVKVLRHQNMMLMPNNNKSIATVKDEEADKSLTANNPTPTSLNNIALLLAASAQQSHQLFVQDSTNSDSN